MSCLAPVGVNPATGFFMIDGEAILDGLETAIRSRCRDRLRSALSNAGHFLLLSRTALANGEHEPLIVTRIASKVRTINLAPQFNWL
jgi:hypothetical protein